MFLHLGSQKPESSDRSRQNYNYLVTISYCCLHYNSGNRFPDFPIGLNWGGICWGGSSTATRRRPGVQREGPSRRRFRGRWPILKQVTSCPRCNPRSGVSRPTMRVHAARFSNGAEFEMSAVIFEKEFNNV